MLKQEVVNVVRFLTHLTSRRWGLNKDLVTVKELRGNQTESIKGGEKTDGDKYQHQQHFICFSSQLTGTETTPLPVSEAEADCVGSGLERMWFRAAEKLTVCI